MEARSLKPEEYYIESEPYYEPVASEVELSGVAYGNQLPVLLKGPAGCGKARFMEHMAWRLKRPLITGSCHDDLTAADLVGRFLVAGGETVWVDGPLADDRRVLPMEKRGHLRQAPPLSFARPSLTIPLPDRAQRPQAEHSPALRPFGVRLPRRGPRKTHRDAGEWH